MFKGYLPLDRMLRHGFSQSGLSDFPHPQVLFDSNAFKYKYQFDEPIGNVVVTPRVLGELAGLPEVFRDYSVKQLIDLLDINFVEPIVSEEDEYLITRAARKVPKNSSRDKGNIGWVDMQQIGHAIDSARNGEYVALVSNDKDICSTMDVLRREHSFLRERAICVSTFGYLKRTYSELLKGLRPDYKTFILRELDMLYRAA